MLFQFRRPLPDICYNLLTGKATVGARDPEAFFCCANSRKKNAGAYLGPFEIAMKSPSTILHNPILRISPYSVRMRENAD